MFNTQNGGGVGVGHAPPSRIAIVGEIVMDPMTGNARVVGFGPPHIVEMGLQEPLWPNMLTQNM